MSPSQPSSSFGPGSIFYDGPLIPNRLHPDQSLARDKKHARPPGVSGVSLNALASPPPSPSRNTIFDMPWSGSAPNISSLRTTTFPNTTSTATTMTHLTDTVSISTESLPPSPLPSSVASIGRAGSPSGHHVKPVGYSSRIHHHNSKGRASSDIELSSDGIERNSRLTDSPTTGCRAARPPADYSDPLTSSSARNSAVSVGESREESQVPFPVPLTISVCPDSASGFQQLSESGIFSSPTTTLLAVDRSLSHPQQKRSVSKHSAFELHLDRTKANLLGHGRHAEVYKALIHPLSVPMRDYLLSRRTTHRKSCADLFQTEPFTTPQTLFKCAAKCLFGDGDSQSVGLAEAEILRRLHSHHEGHNGRQHLVDYYGLYDQTVKLGLSSSEDYGNQEGAPATEGQGEWALLLEYCQHGSIWDWIRQHPDRVGFRQWLTWALQLVEAVDYIHEAGLVHHDIKPHNILLDSSLQAKLSDFGASLFLHESSGDMPTTINHFELEEGLGRGTPPYSAPEMFASASSGAQYGQGIDIYSLGVSLYVIGLTAQEPFHKLKSVLEMVVWIKKGGFWLWEDQGWIHDRGPIPKETPVSRLSMSAAAQTLAHASHLQSPSQLPEERKTSRSNLSKSSSTASLTLVPSLPPINTKLPLDGYTLGSSCSSFGSPSSGIFIQAPLKSSPRRDNSLTFAAGYSPERLGRSSQPATPVSPLPLPSPIIRNQTPRSMSRSATTDDHRKSGEVVMRFLNGEVVPPEVIQLLKDMCHADPAQRPNAKQTLQRLQDMEASLMMDQDSENQEIDSEL